jgi:tRNA threonylcarbamoyladenosine biosynthesis protein TsaE
MTDAPRNLTISLPTRRSTLRLAQLLARVLRVGDLLVLSGPLGSGKTFLTRGIARSLGLPPAERVTSPTFALVQELATEPPVVHADLYRLSAAEQTRELGLVQRREDAILIVEWGEPYIAALGGDALVLKLEREPRQCLISAFGTQSTERVTALAQTLSDHG